MIRFFFLNTGIWLKKPLDLRERADEPMQDDSIEGRSELAEKLRETARQNEQDIMGCARNCGCRFGYIDEQEAVEDDRPVLSGTFGLRMLLSAAILGGFLWMHRENRPVFGYRTEKVVEALGRSTDLQDIRKSVRIGQQERQAKEHERGEP